MDASVARLDTPEECVQFAINVSSSHPELALQARRRAVEMKANTVTTTNDAEREAVEAVFAYEAALSQQQNKKVRATRTWQLIKKLGLIPAFEKTVDREEDTAGFKTLAALGLQDLAFENVVLRHPTVFSEGAVEMSKKRLAAYAQA